MTAPTPKGADTLTGGTGATPGPGLEAAIVSMGERIEARRHALGLTLEQVAERAGASKSYVWEIEKGKNKNPTIRMTWNIAGALGWTLSECIGVSEHTDLLHPVAMRIAVQVDQAIHEAALARANGETGK